MGRRTGDPQTTTPIAATPDFAPPAEARKGLWHRLPFQGKKR